MRNYISVNAKYYKKVEIDRISSHNFRQSRIDYLLDKKYVRFENQHIIYHENMQEDKDKFSDFQRDILLRGQFAKLLKSKEEVQRRRKCYGNKNSNDLIEMVVALSEEQALNYLDNGVDLMKGFDNFAKNMKQHFGLTPLEISLHLDEGFLKNGEPKFNVHAHLVFFNFDFEKEISVWRKVGRKDTKLMQDIAANSFQELGLNFQRGTSKELSTKEHLERNDYILAKQNKELKEVDFKLSSLIELEKDISKQLEEKTKELNEAKAQRMSIYEGTKKLDEEKKALLDEIGNNQKGLRNDIQALRSQRKDIKYILSLESDIERFKAFIDFKNLNKEFEDFKQGNIDTKKLDR